MRWLDIRWVDDAALGFRDDLLGDNQHVAIGERQPPTRQRAEDRSGQILAGPHFTDAANRNHLYLSNHENSYQGRGTTGEYCTTLCPGLTTLECGGGAGRLGRPAFVSTCIYGG